MNAQLSALQQQAQQLSASVTRPIPGSRKIHVPGSRPDLQVPMREIALTRTPTLFGGEENAPVTVYDTSGPYTDPEVRIDLSAGLPALRRGWVEERGDTEQLEGLSSSFCRDREHDPKLDAVRSPRAACHAVHVPVPTSPNHEGLRRDLLAGRRPAPGLHR